MSSSVCGPTVASRCTWSSIFGYTVFLQSQDDADAGALRPRARWRKVSRPCRRARGTRRGSGRARVGAAASARSYCCGYNGAVRRVLAAALISTAALATAASAARPVILRSLQMADVVHGYAL